MTRRLARPLGFIAMLLLVHVGATPPEAGATRAAPRQERLDTIDGVRILHVFGNPFSMGLQHGRTLRAEIQNLYRDYFLKFVGGQDQARRAAQIARIRMMPHIPKSYIDEINGLAIGSGLTFDQVLAAQAFLDLKKAVQCSTIALDGPMTKDGEPMMGRNLDFPSLGVAQKHSIVIVRHPTRGPVTVSVGWPLLVGILSGMNDRGVALAMMEVTTDASSLDGMPYALLFRRALELAQTTEDVVSFIRKSRRTASNNLMVLDRLGASALIEITGQEVAVRRPTSHKLYATNHHRSPKLKQGETCGRYHTITEKLDGRSAPMDLAEMKTLLDAVDIEAMNLQAMIFLPRSGTLHLSVGRIPAAKGPFVELTRGRLFTRPKGVSSP